MSGLNYSDYLNLDRLMSLQQPCVPPELSQRVWASEHFFIVTHQCCELWLAQVLVDLNACTAELDGDGDLETVREYLRRVVAIVDVLVEHVTVLNTLPVACFADFRRYLGTASGAQSPHFRALDAMLGLLGKPSPLGAAFAARVARAGFDLDDVWRRESACGGFDRIGSALLDVGQAHWRWKASHAALVARFLGSQPGTGGSSGADHLVRKLTMPFPELREAQRSSLLDPVDRTRVAS